MALLGTEEEFPWESGQPWSLSNSEENLSGGSSGDKDLLGVAGEANQPLASVTAAKGKKRGREVAAKGSGESDEHEMHIWTERERRKKMRNMFSNLHALLPNLPPKADKSTIVDEAVSYIKSLQQTLQGLQNQKLERLRLAPTTMITLDEPSSSSTMAATTAPCQLLHGMIQMSADQATRESFMADMGKNLGALVPLCSPKAVSIPRFSLGFTTWSSPAVVLNISGEDAHINISSVKKPGLFSAILFVLEKHKLEVVSANISSDYFKSMYMIHARASNLGDQFPEALMIDEIFKLAVGEILMWLST